jgi:hypothetical protein
VLYILRFLLGNIIFSLDSEEKDVYDKCEHLESSRRREMKCKGFTILALILSLSPYAPKAEVIDVVTDGQSYFGQSGTLESPLHV